MLFNIFNRNKSTYFNLPGHLSPLSLSSKYYNTNLIILALEIAMLVESDTLSKPILTDF